MIPLRALRALKPLTPLMPLKDDAKIKLFSEKNNTFTFLAPPYLSALESVYQLERLNYLLAFEPRLLIF